MWAREGVNVGKTDIALQRQDEVVPVDGEWDECGEEGVAGVQEVGV